MDKTKDEAKISVPEQSRAPRKKRRRKKNYAEDMYGARPAPEDARIMDEYARLNEMDRAEVVRLALHKFALLQQMKYPRKDEFQELKDKAFREHFAAVFEQLETISKTLQEPPQEIGVRHWPRAFGPDGDAIENNSASSSDAVSEENFARHTESFLREQGRLLEQVLLASTLSLRLLANFLIEPQLRHLEPSDVSSLEPYLNVADGGKTAWGVATAEVMRRTGKQVLQELDLPAPEAKSRTPDAPQNCAPKRAATTLTDGEIAAAL